MGGEKIGHLHAAQNNDMQHREKYRKVTLRRHPQLDVRHALESSLYLADSLHETNPPKQRQNRDMRSSQVARQHARSRRRKQRLVGEAELHPEQQGEIQMSALSLVFPASSMSVSNARSFR